jgi:maltooligosyltrehalose synthase
MMQGFLQSGWQLVMRDAVDQASAAHETPGMQLQSLIKLPKDIKTWTYLNALSQELLKLMGRTAPDVESSEHLAWNLVQPSYPDSKLLRESMRELQSPRRDRIMDRIRLRRRGMACASGLMPKDN